MLYRRSVDEPAKIGLPLPRLYLTVGVTGHRPPRLGTGHLCPLEESVRALFPRLSEAVQDVRRAHRSAFVDETPCLRLVSALAEGADMLVAAAAFDAGWRVDACLPFGPDIYADDFAEGASRARFEELCGRATSVFALPGERAREEAAYEAAGRVMMEQSDIVLALWDGDAARGRGGTAQIVAEAVARHIPVIHVDTNCGAPPMLLWSGLSDLDQEQPTLDGVPRAEASEVLAAVVSVLCAPPDNAVDCRMRDRFFQERTHKRTPAWPYPLLMALAGVRRFSLRDLLPQHPDDCACYLRNHLSPMEDTGAYSAALNGKLIGRFAMADAAASYYAQIFRSGFVVNFGLAAIAVLLAAMGLLFPSVKLPLIAAELALILAILANTRASAQMGWHERWMDDRHLAEQLRALAISSLLGDLDLRNGEARDAAMVPGWVFWLGRATARELGFPTATVDQPYLARVRSVANAVMEDQIAYHTASSAQMRHLDHRLHKAGEYLFGGTVIACVLWIGLKLSGAPMAMSGGLDLTDIVTAITAVLPAMGAALYGIRMHGDFAGIADRSLVTVKRLERLKRSMECDPLEFDRLLARLRRLSDIMLTDVANWRTTYQARPLTLPG